MTSRLLPAPGRRIAVALALTAVVVAFGSWALWPVRDSACVAYSGSYIPVGAPKAAVDAAVQRSHEEALAGGACGPERPRFIEWTR